MWDDLISWDGLAELGEPYVLPSAKPVEGTPFLPDELIGGRIIVRMAPGADLTQPYTAWPWRDITSDVLQDDGREIDITQGSQDQSSQPFSARCTYAVKNPDGRWTARNPYGIYFPNLRQDTPTWVVIELGGIEYTQFMGFINGFSPTIDLSSGKSIVQIEAYGRRKVLERKSTATVSLSRSPMSRGISSQPYAPVRTQPIRYWPFEDEANSRQAAEYFGGPAIIPSRAASWAASNTGIPGSSALPSLSAGTTIAASVPRSGDGTEWRIEFAFSLPANPGADTLIATWTTDGTAVRWELWYINSLSGGGVFAEYSFKGYNSAGTEVLGEPSISIYQFPLSTETPEAPVGTIMFCVVNAHVDGSDGTSLNLTITISYQDQSVPVDDSGGVTTNGLILTNIVTASPASVTAGHLGSFVMNVPTGLDGMHFGQLAFFDVSEAYSVFDFGFGAFYSFDIYDHLYCAGLAGESLYGRLTRLALEGRVEVDVSDIENEEQIGLVGATAIPMGIQSVGGIVDVLDETAYTGHAILYDGFNGGFWAHNTRDRYSQDPALTLDGTVADLFGGFEPTDDDLGLANTVKAARSGGSASIGRVYDGDNGIDTIGEVGVQLTRDLVLLTDEFVAHRAQWEAHVASTPGFRYPPLGLNMRRRPELAHAVLAMRLGNLIQLTVPFADIIRTEPEKLIVEGWHVRLSKYVWQIDFNCSRGNAYNVWRLTDDEFARVGSAGTTLGANMSVEGELGTADGTFESGVSGWSAVDGTFAQSSAQAYAGTYSGLLTVTGAPTQTYVRASASVTPGEYYSVTMYVYSASGDDVAVAIDWFDVDGGYLSTSSTSYTVAAATWTRLVVAAVAPAAGVTADYGPTITGSPTAGDAIWVDAVSFRGAAGLVAAVTPWVDSDTYPDSFPMPLRISGTKVTCTEIVGTAAPQIAVLSDTTKPFAAGDDVQIWQLNVMGY